MICDACASAAHWDCAGAGCGCDCDPDEVLAALEEPRRDPCVAREFGLWDVSDAAPCPYCGEEDCEASCTGAILADEDAGEEDREPQP